MSDMNRRTLCRNLGLALTALGVTGRATAQSGAAAATTPGKSQNHLHTELDHCKAFVLEQMPLRYSDAGAPTHDILQGTAPVNGGELVELHETTIAPGAMPHPAHQHPHVEFILVREGTVDFIVGDKHTLLTPGSVGYTAPNEMHGFRNAGTAPATYFIFSLNKQA